MQKLDLDGKIVVVTGAAGVLGRAFCADIAKSGGIVVLADVNDIAGKLADQINNELSREVAYFRDTDITGISSVKELITFLINKFGRVDALVNSAYPRNQNYGKKFDDVTYEDFCENVSLHLGGYFLISQLISRVMIKQNCGIIINLASIYGVVAPRFEIYEGTDMTMPVEYAAIKGAIVNLTRYLAAYLGKWNIRVNCISPGGVYDNQPPEFVKRYTQHVLLGNRMAAVEDIAGILLFLLREESGYITGQNIIADGGWSL